MSRMLSLSTVLVSGCIIYEEDWDRENCRSCEGGDTTTVTATAGDDDDDAVGGTDTEEPPAPDPGPLVTADLELTESQAYPGDSLLSSLVVVSGNVDLASVVSVGFERDVVVLDQLARPGEIVLLLAVGDDALPGEVDVFVETEQGEGWLLAKPFVILEAVACPTGGGDDTATDTGCP